MGTKVFISAGTPETEEQKSFYAEVLRAVERTGLEPRRISKKEWNPHNPISSVKSVLEECQATIVVAYTRYKVDSGSEIREEGDKDLSGWNFPTPWNHIEAAMAIAKGMPVLVVAEKGLKPDTVFETTKDVRPFWTELDPTVVDSDEFIGALNRWRDEVLAVAEAEEEPQPTLHTQDRVDEGTVFKHKLKWAQFVAAGTFGVLSIVALVALAIAFPEPTEHQRAVFRITTALAAAGVGALLPGFIEVNYQTWLRAGGAFGLFALVYLVDPSGAVQGSADQGEQQFLKITRVDAVDDEVQGGFRLFLEVNGEYYTYPLTNSWGEFGGAQLGRIPLPPADSYQIEFRSTVIDRADIENEIIGTSQTELVFPAQTDDPIKREYKTGDVHVKYEIRSAP